MGLGSGTYVKVERETPIKGDMLVQIGDQYLLVA
jgi:hypothetical protein